MSKERLKLVESWSELRVGVIIVFKGCDWCGGGTHRGILLAPYMGEVRAPDNVVRTASGFFVEPDWHGDLGPGMIVTERQVARGKVYLVDDGLEDSHHQTTKTRTPRKLERQRAGR